jgi:gluconokinase
MIIVLMGVSGSGKTTVGRLLAAGLGCAFYDADDFHPPTNVTKMRNGEPLNDDDRLPWLEKLQELIGAKLAAGSNAVLACSALKAAYRDFLLIDERVRLVFLKGGFSLIQQRMNLRRGHYMNPSLLESQFATLEEPERALTVDIEESPERIVDMIRGALEV